MYAWFIDVVGGALLRHPREVPEEILNTSPDPMQVCLNIDVWLAEGDTPIRATDFYMRGDIWCLEGTHGGHSAAECVLLVGPHPHALRAQFDHFWDKWFANASA